MSSSAVVEELRGRLAAPAPGTFGVRELLPVRPPLDALFPGRGLARGSVVEVDGSVWLALAVASAASAAGSWCAVVGMPELGPAAAAESGVDLTRLVLVETQNGWATTAATLLDGVDVVIVKPPSWAKAAEARRLAARARERRGVLLALGGWPDAVDLRVRVDSSEVVGLHRGYGRIAGRRCRITSSGRGAASRERRATATFPKAT